VPPGPVFVLPERAGEAQKRPIPRRAPALRKGLAILAVLGGGKLRHGAVKGAAYGTWDRVWGGKVCTQLSRCWLQPRFRVI